jgi:ribosomal protein S18 acetylase RimI-like enzyme
VARPAETNRAAPGGADGITLRSRIDADGELLCRLYASTRADEMAIVPWSEKEKGEFLRMQFEAQTKHYEENYADAEFLVVERHGEAIGRLYLDRRPDEIRIVDIALFPEWRGQGIGGALIADVLDNAAASELVVRIHVEKNNPALDLYDRMGFRRIGDAGVYWLMECIPPGTRSVPLEDE